jgi:hypothetical protein
MPFPSGPVIFSEGEAALASIGTEVSVLTQIDMIAASPAFIEVTMVPQAARSRAAITKIEKKNLGDNLRIKVHLLKVRE